ncbi:hypothetical protein CANARDRAFT_201958 [[Candida] arabinofermentans NRRL YB-2248]|uniref:Ergosterol biosynthesis protein n=1 Tax=[Candida] arabinofermentans NRRL YB-2248 TaxID=983967 RepID=A0A1E4SWX7_9ASCO|nr:hypothetical protein CANARDRAFT_201958 [[Candida] arabinofermentans NRRL YB-2248]
MSFIDSIVSHLPQHEGLLPKWLLFISVVSIFNSVQTYTNINLTKKVYDGLKSTNQVTELSARTFGTWTLMSSIIRFYCSYYISNPQIYQICIYSYYLAFFHFGFEWFYFKTAKFGKGLLGPLIVSTVSITWMLNQRDFYTI